MNRLFRKLKAGIKAREAAILLVAFAAAFSFGRAAGSWYSNSGRQHRLVTMLNSIQADPIGTNDSDGLRSISGERSKYAFYTPYNINEVTAGIFSSPRADYIPQASGYSAEQLSVLSGDYDPGKIAREAAGGDRSYDGLAREAAATADAAVTATYAAGGEASQSGDDKAADGALAGGDMYDAFDEDKVNYAGEIIGDIDEYAETDEYYDENAGENTDIYADDNAEAYIAGDAGISSAIADNESASGESTDYGADGGDSDEPVYVVKVVYNGERRVFETVGKKVSELFAENGIKVSKDDKITGAYLDGVIDSDLYIEIKKIKHKTITEEIAIPAKTVYRDNAEITDGKPRVIREGSDGLKRVEYKITYVDGIQKSKEKIKEVVIKEAVSKIVEQGAKGKKIGAGGVEFSYKNVIDVKCTAYTSSYADTGKRPGDPGFGITKTGEKARKGIVAVDPKVIPLGTRMYIAILDESIEDYGFAVAGDIGGKIKGKKVDLYFDATAEEIRQFGVRKAKVYILD